MNIRLLRGQVVIRENLTADTDHYRHIIVPGVSTAHDADAVQRARKWHRGTVLAMGAPMLSKTGAEILPEFKIGDEVLFHWQHREKSWTREWSDGLLACWVPQAYVDAVLEEEEPIRLIEGSPEAFAEFKKAVDAADAAMMAMVMPPDVEMKTLCVACEVHPQEPEANGLCLPCDNEEGVAL